MRFTSRITNGIVNTTYLSFLLDVVSVNNFVHTLTATFVLHDIPGHHIQFLNCIYFMCVYIIYFDYLTLNMCLLLVLEFLHDWHMDFVQMTNLLSIYWCRFGGWMMLLMNVRAEIFFPTYTLLFAFLSLSHCVLGSLESQEVETPNPQNTANHPPTRKRRTTSLHSRESARRDPQQWQAVLICWLGDGRRGGWQEIRVQIEWNKSMVRDGWLFGFCWSTVWTVAPRVRRIRSQMIEAQSREQRPVYSNVFFSEFQTHKTRFHTHEERRVGWWVVFWGGIWPSLELLGIWM